MMTATQDVLYKSTSYLYLHLYKCIADMYFVFVAELINCTDLCVRMLDVNYILCTAGHWVGDPCEFTPLSVHVMPMTEYLSLIHI